VAENSLASSGILEFLTRPRSGSFLGRTTASRDLTVTSVGADKVKYICDDKDEQSEDLSVFIKLAENTLKNGAKLTKELRQLTGYERGTDK